MLDVTDITFGAAKRLAVLQKRFGEIMMLIIILVKGVNIRKIGDEQGNANKEKYVEA